MRPPPFAKFSSKKRKFSVPTSVNALYGTKPPVFLLKKMGNFWAIPLSKWGRNGEEMGKLFGVVYQPSDSEPITAINLFEPPDVNTISHNVDHVISDVFPLNVHLVVACGAFRYNVLVAFPFLRLKQSLV